MGWCGGTSIFDKTAKVVLAKKISDKDKIEILEALAKEMEQHDWDCQDETSLRSSAIVRKVLELEED